MPCARCFPQWFGTFAMLPEWHWSYVKANAVSIRVAFGQAAMTEALATTPLVEKFEHPELQRFFASFDHGFMWFLPSLSGIGIYNTRIKLWSFVSSNIHKHHDQHILLWCSGGFCFHASLQRACSLGHWRGASTPVRPRFPKTVNANALIAPAKAMES